MHEAKELLRSLGVRPSKGLGQNFLIDPGTVEEIIRFGRPHKDEKIVEVGGGLGALTAGLNQFPGLIVIEIDAAMADHLSSRFPSAKILQTDVRSVDFSRFGSQLTVFGNLPYSFSTEIVFHLVNQHNVIKRAVLLLQSDFVDRMVAKPGSKTYGTLSIGVQLWCDLRSGPLIPGSAFYPSAEVDSKLVELVFRAAPLAQVSDEAAFQKIVKLAFRQRRKKVFNSIRSSGMFESEDLKRAFSAAGIDTGLRAEALSISDFAKLTNELKD